MSRRSVGDCDECGRTTRGDLCLECRDSGVTGDTKIFAELIAEELGADK